jgi:hypothetical protein
MSIYFHRKCSFFLTDGKRIAEFLLEGGKRYEQKPIKRERKQNEQKPIKREKKQNKQKPIRGVLHTHNSPRKKNYERDYPANKKL